MVTGRLFCINVSHLRRNATQVPSAEIVAEFSMNKRSGQYFVNGRDEIPGWFFRIDAEIFYLVTNAQNSEGWNGAVAEIGLHYGKSFVALCLALKNTERAYGIDVFDRQDLNKDGSGRGNRSAVENNLTRWGVDLSSVILDGRSSEIVMAQDILKSVGDVRFFSIDGGHWYDIVCGDLLLAERTLAKFGVIAIDDFLRPEWPDVSNAYFSWHRSKSKPLIPFAIGFNKLYLCDQDYAQFYGDVLDNSAFLRSFVTKRYNFIGRNVPVYQRFVSPEDFGFRGLFRWYLKARHPGLSFGLKWYLKVYHPDLYVCLKKFVGRSN
jgi:hypothetical protein